LTDATNFAIDMGKDGNNFALHFNPCFNLDNDQNLIVFNTTIDGQLGEEQRENYFPFKKGTTVEVCIKFEWNFFVVRLPDGHYLNFPNRTETTKIDYVQVIGDFVIRTFAFE
ncbi:galectin-1-like, partial [Vombatus ursinus]|uniref:galectin-1-like n=1 Tax=Vombatus ursinus TaxID=29139 RepID=UPI000FFD1904